MLTTKFDTLVHSISDLRASLSQSGIIKLRLKDEPSDNELLALACGFSQNKKEPLLEWDFGAIMKMQYDSNAANYLFSDEAVPFHWDGAFYREPRYLMFYCDESHGDGGATLFCNTSEMISDFDINDLRKVSLNFKTEKLAHYGGEIEVKLAQKHPSSLAEILRFAERVESRKNPVSLQMINADESLYEKLVNSAYKHSIVHHWQRGDLIIVDNFLFIHGRKALGQNLKRRFRRIQIM